MKVLLIGYGKMGKTLEKILIDRGHEIAGIIDPDHQTDISSFSSTADVAIEFSHPEAAYSNIRECINAGIPVVCGTTGWLDQYDAVCEQTLQQGGAFFYSSNFSVGVNIFFALNRKLAQLMDGHSEYTAEVHETHHIHKMDAPSGTAITIAEGLIDAHRGYDQWQLESAGPSTIPIHAYREGEVYGLHTVRYDSPIDMIEITHDAHSRQGFAIGAVLAAEWLPTREGVYGMSDMLGL